MQNGLVFKPKQQRFTTNSAESEFTKHTSSSNLPHLDAIHRSKTLKASDNLPTSGSNKVIKELDEIDERSSINRSSRPVMNSNNLEDLYKSSDSDD